MKFNLYVYLHKEHASYKQTELLCSTCNVCYAVAPNVAVYVAILFLHYDHFVVISTIFSAMYVQISCMNEN